MRTPCDIPDRAQQGVAPVSSQPARLRRRRIRVHCPLFFVLLFAIMETALMFFAAQVLETGTQDSARLMMTNQAQNAAMTQAQFKQDICGRVAVLFTARTWW